MQYRKAFDMAWKHGWRLWGVSFIGNASYTVLRRPGCRRQLNIHPDTGRVFTTEVSR